MAVTQYIGSRYVPLFADPIEWSSQNTYEPLTIVIHEGNSYTSKQAVPKDIAINNEDFWALTGNYNAQVELYRRETARVSDLITGLEEIIPADLFSAQDTVKSYVDNGLEGVRDYVLAIIGERFNDTDTISAYADAVDATLATLAPITETGVGYDQGVADTYFWYMLTFPKSMFNANIYPSGDPIGDSATLLEYARREKPYFCVNCTNNEHFVFNGAEYNGDTQYFPPTRAGFFAKRSTNDVDFDLFRADGQMSVRTLKEQGYNYVAGSWQPLIMDGIAVPIDSYATFSEYNNEACLGFDENNFYYAGFYGRMYGKPGVTAQMVQDFGLARNWDGLIYFDGGDSVRAYFGEIAPISIVPRLNVNINDRVAYCNVTFERKF